MADGPTQIPSSDHDAFRRALPGHLGLISRRLLALCEHGWDINGLCLLEQDARRLHELGRRFDLDAGLLKDLDEVRSRMAPCLEAPRMPADSERDALRDAARRIAAGTPDIGPEPVAATAIGDASRIEVPPAGYWRRWTGDAVPAKALVPRPTDSPAVAVIENEPAPEPEPAPKPPKAKTRAKAKPAKKSAGTDGAVAASAKAADADVPAPAPPAPPPPPADPPGPLGDVPVVEAGDTPRVYHLTDGSGLGCEVDQGMEAAGWEVEVLADAAELQELLAALPPNLVVIDAAFMDGLEEIGAVLRATRQRTGVRIPLAAIVDADELATRLSARRAGVDALVIDPPGAPAVLDALRNLLAPPAESPFRVLIVEDDASQALFAESILRNANMETEVVDDPFDVLPALENFAPDMVLMDLHMPGCNGMELTSLIRDDERFLNLPIVFLSGESDQDMQFEALDAGGDDFIAKPVRPRHLISAVQNRIRRARALAQRGRPDVAVAARESAATRGLTDRGNLMTQAQLRLQATRDGAALASGMLFMEVEGGAQLRDRLGLSSLEQLLQQAATVIETRLGRDALLCRFGDASFMVLLPDGSEDGLLQAAVSVRHALAAYAFEANDRPLRLRFSIGACSLGQGFKDVGELLNAAERACRRARASERGVEVYIAPASPDAVREAALLQRIREGIGGEGFELVFQPIVAVQGGEDAQFQTLLRMREADGRLMPAGELLPVAERAGLMLEIDRWVLDKALDRLASGADASRQTRLFVPQSMATLCAPDQAQWLIKRLEGSGVPGGAVVIELRTDDAIVHYESFEPLCHTLTDVGVGFCMSRFELGENSQAMLERLPLAYVKLASKYLEANSERDVRDELRVLIDVAHRNNLKVIGHRVEDAQSAATLWMSGIDYIQGNLVQSADAGTSFDFHSAVL